MHSFRLSKTKSTWKHNQYIHQYKSRQESASFQWYLDIEMWMFVALLSFLLLILFSFKILIEKKSLWWNVCVYLLLFFLITYAYYNFSVHKSMRILRAHLQRSNKTPKSFLTGMMTIHIEQLIWMKSIQFSSQRKTL